MSINEKEYSRWLENRPQAVRELAMAFPIGEAVYHNGVMQGYVMAYYEGLGKAYLGIVPNRPTFENFNNMAQQIEKVCRDCVSLDPETKHEPH